MVHSELSFKRYMKREGWNTIKMPTYTPKGIPDFLCYKENKLIFVEVKFTRHKNLRLSDFREEQIEFLAMNNSFCFIAHKYKTKWTFYKMLGRTLIKQ